MRLSKGTSSEESLIDKAAVREEVRVLVNSVVAESAREVPRVLGL
jgi:hypothetical protein